MPLKPRLRGVLHQWACAVSVPLGLALVTVAGTARARIALSVYALSLMGLFGVSALYHRITWRSVTARDWMRQLDHSMIFVLIAGGYTPFAMLALHGLLATAILVAVWTGALLGVAFNLAWSSAPTWLHAGLYVLLGWVAAAALPQLGGAIGMGGLMLLGIGGVLHTLGAVVYAVKRPDPLPAVFGYQEVFHTLVIAAAAPPMCGHRLLDPPRVSRYGGRIAHVLSPVRLGARWRFAACADRALGGGAVLQPVGYKVIELQLARASKLPSMPLRDPRSGIGCLCQRVKVYERCRCDRAPAALVLTRNQDHIGDDEIRAHDG